MKYLQDYMDQAQTDLFNKTGAFFAFSTRQFEEGKKDGVKYVNMGAGLICPKNNVVELIEKLDNIFKEAIKKDLEENGKVKIIIRELYNHECFYTGDITNAVATLEPYNFTIDEILKIYREEYHFSV